MNTWIQSKNPSSFIQKTFLKSKFLKYKNVYRCCFPECNGKQYRDNFNLLSHFKTHFKREVSFHNSRPQKTPTFAKTVDLISSTFNLIIHHERKKTSVSPNFFLRLLPGLDLLTNPQRSLLALTLPSKVSRSKLFRVSKMMIIYNKMKDIAWRLIIRWVT